MAAKQPDLANAAAAYRSASGEAIRRHRLLYLIQAALLIAAGVVALTSPMFWGLALTSLLGWLLVIGGVLQAISLLGARQTPAFLPQLTSAGLGILIGLLVLSAPGEGLLVLTLLLIVFLGVEGIGKIVLGLSVRPVPGWGWLIASGALALLLGGWLWSSMPTAAAWLLGVVLGINLIAQGFAIGATAVASRG